MKEKEGLVALYDSVTTAIRDVLRHEGVASVAEAELKDVFEKRLVSSGKVHAKYARVLHDLIAVRKAADAGKLSKTDVDLLRREAHEFIRFLVEYLQRKRVQELERVRVRVRWGENRFGEVTLLGETAFILKDVGAEQKELLKAEVKPDGALALPVAASWEEFEQKLANVVVPPRVFLREKTLEALKMVFGKDVELMMGG